MTILDTIIDSKRREVESAKRERPLGAPPQLRPLGAPPYRKTLSLRQSLKERTGIIAEFKRKSPSRGVFLEGADAATITAAYTAAGASGLSVLTDGPFFGGSRADLEAARINDIPILRKDFIIDPYQVYESRDMGADVILLIAACLTPAQVRELGALARSLDMEVILELHDEEELGHVCPEVDIVGINNRDLKTFQVDIARSLRMADRLPADLPRIAESGISDPAVMRNMRAHGFSGFLIGEAFMKEKDPGLAFKAFVHAYQSL